MNSGCEARRGNACYTLSRLKGIETVFSTMGRPGYDLDLLHTFPFEGN